MGKDDADEWAVGVILCILYDFYSSTRIHIFKDICVFIAIVAL